MATTTTLDTLKINYLTQAQYDTALSNSQINANEIYLTPQDTIGTVTGLTTVAGTHSAGSQTVSSGVISMNVPTKTSHLTNDSGFLTSYVDENMKWTASTTSNTYYPLVSTSTATTSTANTLNGIDFYQYYNTAGGYRRLDLGNATAYKTAGGAYGTIRLYGAAATYYGDLVPGVLGTTTNDGHISANRTWTLPDKTGTIALTSDIPTVPSITLNGNSTTSPSFYAPTTAGTNGYYLKSNGSGAPSWTSFPTIPSITLNGSSTTSPSFYAPTSAGTNGYILKSNGSGAPTWFSATLTDKNVQIDTVTNNTEYRVLGVNTSSSSTITTTINQDNDISYIPSSSDVTLSVGNSTLGKLRLGKVNSSVSSFTTIQPSHTAARTITLPDKTGTVALTSDIPTVSSFLETTYPVGSTYTTSTNTNPGTWLGGTWTLTDKSYKYQWITSGFTFNSTNVGGGDFVAMLHGHSIAFRLTWTFKIAVSDSEIEIGTLTKTSVGITATGGYMVYPVSFNDMYNAMGQGAFNFAADTTAVFKTYDWVTRATSYPSLNADNSSYVYFVYVARSHTEMLDSFCDQFVWERTA